MNALGAANTLMVSIDRVLGNVAIHNNENVVLGISACYFSLPARVDKHGALLIIDYAGANAKVTMF